MATTTRAPWKRPNPRLRAGKKSRHLSPAKKTVAKTRAKRAGRRYPNLVDNMRMASIVKRTAHRKATKKRRGKAASKRSLPKKPTKKSSRQRRARPRAGRTAFARKDGSHLKPGVTKKQSDMTPKEMRRKGSWAVRFYGRKKLPPLMDRQGQPTRHALSAHAWGEPVPKTIAAARRIATKGERLLQRYRRTKSKSRH